MPTESGTGDEGDAVFGEPSMERIYIGGLDPPRLTVEMVSRRLTALHGVDVLKVDFSNKKSFVLGEDRRRFFFLTARLRRKVVEGVTSASVPKTALEVVSMKYNNVQWRGCTLRVEPARQHFLDRLTVEREESEKGKDLEKVENDPAAVARAVNVSSGTVPRTLRIRRRFGEEAFCVDTKPLFVSSDDGWSGLRRAVRGMKRMRDRHMQTFIRKQQLQKRIKKRGGVMEEKLKEGTGSLNSNPRLNRAVHFRFRIDGEEGDETDTQSILAPKTEGEAAKATVSALSAGRSSTFTDGIIAHKSYGVQPDKVDRSLSGTEGAQILSDSSVSSACSGSSSTDASSPALRDPKPGLQPFCPEDRSSSEVCSSKSSSDLANEKDNANSSESSSRNESQLLADAETAPENIIRPKGDDHSDERNNNAKLRRQYPPSSSYAWSDEYDSTVDDHDEAALSSGKEVSSRCFTRKVNENDEFSAAFDINGENENEELETTTSNPFPFAEDKEDLDMDLKSNLEVLAQLFPDMAGSKPKLVSSDVDRTHADITPRRKVDNTSQQRSVWGANSLMCRFDPTQAASVKKYEVSANATETVAEGEDRDESGVYYEESNNEEDSERQPRSGDSDTNGSGEMEETLLVGKKPIEDKEANRDDTMQNPYVATQRKEGTIYEQKKLEDIFQRAREGDNAVATFKLSGLFQDNMPDSNGPLSSRVSAGPSNAGDGSGSPFNCSFDVIVDKAAQPPDRSVAPTTPFSFSFDVANEKSTVRNETSPRKLSGTRTASKTEDLYAVEKSETKYRCNPPLKKLRGTRFPQSILGDYEASFFKLNEGVQVMKNLEAMLSDAACQIAWSEERKSLTLDWRRKHKYAFSKKQKFYF